MHVKDVFLLFSFFLMFSDIFPITYFSCPYSLPQTQYDALYDLYNATDGPFWCDVYPPWNFSSSSSSSNSPCIEGWKGVTCGCSNSSAYIEQLNMFTFCMYGTIPSSISALSNLNTFNLSTNMIYGSLPSTIGNLLTLEALEVRNNEISGSLPSTLCHLTSLTYLSLENNKLVDSIPLCIDMLSSLKFLYLGANFLASSLPPQLYNISTLEVLDLSFNVFEGTLSSYIGKLSNLRYILLLSNEFTSHLPDTIFDLKSLNYLDIQGNRFSGPLTPRFGNLNNLVALLLSNNLFSGNLPCDIFLLSNLSVFLISENNLRGSIPECISSSQKLEVFSIQSSSLSGSISENIFLLPRLRVLYLNNNYFTGKIPQTIGSQTSMQFLSLYSNELTGSISKQIFHSTQLTELYLDGNHLTGTIPTEIVKISNIRAITLYNNLLTGTLPSEMFVSPHLHIFLMFKNIFTGTIPARIENSSSLLVLSLYDNCFTGTIPSFAAIKNLAIITLYSNYFSGTLPSSIARLSNLLEIYVNNNFFGGRLDPVFNSSVQTQLRAISVAENYFSGTIPSEWFNMKSLHELSAASNCFRGNLRQAICYLNRTLEVLNFDGVGSKPDCAGNLNINKNKPFFIKGHFSALGLVGPIPACLLSFPHLRSLHLSTNFLNGKLPDISPNSNLSDFTAANNILTGTIPMSIQHHSFHSLNLANNRLKGTLSNDFSLASTQATLTLAVNRLSGPFPNTFKDFYSSNLTKLDILSSNIFACKTDEIPKQDEYAKSYSCDSTDLNVASYVWIAFLILSCTIILISYAIFRCFPEWEISSVKSIKTFFADFFRWRSIAKCVMRQNHNEDGLITMKLVGHGVNLSSIPHDTLVELNAYFVAINIIFRWTAMSGVLILFVIIPTYTTMSLYYSIVSYQYGYILSMAFLHGVAPTVFLAIVVAAILNFVAFVLNILYSMFTRMLGKGDIPTESKISPTFQLRLYVKLIVLHSINIGVTLVVNSFYVNTILNNKNITQAGFFVIQIFVGGFKIIWNAVFIPWCSFCLQPYLSQYRNMQNRLIMSITNFIIAPCLATLAVNQSCFYFVIKEAAPSTTLTNFHICTFPTICSEGVCCGNYADVAFATTSTKSFQYSYACGTALIVSYSPVLLYTYVAYGFLLPIFRYVRARYIKYFVRLFASIFRDEDELRGRVRGVEVIMNMKLHVTVLLTFGLASSILGIVIVSAMLTDCWTSTIFAGRFLAVNYPMNLKSLPALNDSVINPVQPSEYPIQDEESSSELSAYRSRNASRITERRAFDLKDSWRGLFASYTIVIISVSIFWAFMFFDMIADGSGVYNGIISSVIFGCLTCAFALIINNYSNVIDTRIVHFSRIENRLLTVFNMESLLVLSKNSMNTMLNGVEERKTVEIRSYEFS